MNIKQFLKPNRKKIIIFFALLLISLSLPYYYLSGGPSGGGDIVNYIVVPNRIFPLLIYDFLMTGEFLDFFNYPWSNLFVILLIIELTIYYLTACLIVWIFNKFVKKPS